LDVGRRVKLCEETYCQSLVVVGGCCTRAEALQDQDLYICYTDLSFTGPRFTCMLYRLCV